MESNNTKASMYAYYESVLINQYKVRVRQLNIIKAIDSGLANGVKIRRS